MIVYGIFCRIVFNFLSISKGHHEPSKWALKLSTILFRRVLYFYCKDTSSTNIMSYMENNEKETYLKYLQWFSEFNLSNFMKWVDRWVVFFLSVLVFFCLGTKLFLFKPFGRLFSSWLFIIRPKKAERWLKTFLERCARVKCFTFWMFIHPTKVLRKERSFTLYFLRVFFT